jgi:hypothetical protein
MDLGSIFLIIGIALLVGIFVSQPFLKIKDSQKLIDERKTAQHAEHVRSGLMAERDRILTALQELDFDDTLGKIPAEDYPLQRAALLKSGADILRQLDALEPVTRDKRAAEDRLEAAIATRRADAGRSAEPKGEMDDLELAIAARRRIRQEKSAGFCPKCGNAVQKSDVFCSRCGATLNS